MLVSGGSVLTVGETASAGEIATILTRIGGMAPMVLTDKQSMERLFSAIGDRYMKDRLLGYIQSAQGLASIDPERGYKLMLILSYWFPDMLRVASTGDIYVSKSWTDADYYFKSSDVYNIPVYRAPVNLNPYVYVGNTPDYLDPEYDISPEEAFSKAFGYSITDEIETWIAKTVIEPWSIIEG